METKFVDASLVETKDFVFFLPKRFMSQIQNINTSPTPVEVREKNLVDVEKQSPAYNFELLNLNSNKISRSNGNNCNIGIWN